MRHLRLLPDRINIDFVGKRIPAFIVTAALLLGAIGALFTQGLNLGIDFAGGILIEAKSDHPINVAELRTELGALNLGAVELQEFGGPRDILIRVQQQDSDAANTAAIASVRNALGEGWDYRRVELVGPKVGDELLRDGIIATVLAIIGITVYVAFRFEWQFGVAALVATIHDVLLTVGLFAVLQFEFDLTSVAALLTLAGYSINDTVVVFDRIRELLRRHKTVPLPEIVNLAVNQTLARTILTSGSTLLAILPLLLFGGSTLFAFTLALVFGILVGTFSSVYVAGSLLIYMTPIRGKGGPAEKAENPEETPAASPGA